MKLDLNDTPESNPPRVLAPSLFAAAHEHIFRLQQLLHHCEYAFGKGADPDTGGVRIYFETDELLWERKRRLDQTIEEICRALLAQFPKGARYYARELKEGKLVVDAVTTWQTNHPYDYFPKAEKPQEAVLGDGTDI